MSPPSGKSYTNILIVKLSAIGDVVHALPVASVLKKSFPEARITWAVEKASYDLLTENPHIDEIILIDKPKFQTFRGFCRHLPELARLLKSRHFDLVLDLQGLFKSAIIAYMSKAPKRLVYCNSRELSYLFSKRVVGANRLGHVVDRYLDVVRTLNCPVDEVTFPINITQAETASAFDIASQAGLVADQPYIVMAPGTNWPTKCWPTAYYAELAGKLHPEGFVPVLVGGPQELHLAEEILFYASVPIVNLIGKTNLKQLASIIKNAHAFVGGDTGPMHIAVAVGTPAVALFGPSDSKRNGPYHGRNKVLIAPRSCAGCQKQHCDDHPCLELISVQEVWEALRQLLVK